VLINTAFVAPDPTFIELLPRGLQVDVGPQAARDPRPYLGGIAKYFAALAVEAEIQHVLLNEPSSLPDCEIISSHHRLGSGLDARAISWDAVASAVRSAVRMRS
jgi:hypothetical protein